MRDTRRRHRMTWPMHDAGSTTPDPEPGPDLGLPEQGHADLRPGDDQPRRGRHAAPDPLPPLDGPMPGGGPSPAETTLPLALTWPAPPTAPHRSPVPGSPGAPPGWRRVPRTTGQPPAGPDRTRYTQPTFTPTRPGAPGPSAPPGPPGPPGGGPRGPGVPGGPGGPGGPGARARRAGAHGAPAATQRSSLVRS